MKTLHLTDDELKVIAAMVNSDQWRIAKIVASLQDKCAAALKESEEETLGKSA